jgi:hypothetical protein
MNYNKLKPNTTQAETHTRSTAMSTFEGLSHVRSESKLCRIIVHCGRFIAADWGTANTEYEPLTSLPGTQRNY